jgi:hypothetical protein
MLTVHVRINDAAGKPTPVRARLLGPGDAYHAPLGRLADFATGAGEDVGGNLLLGSERFAYIDGTCEVRLPPGPLLVEAHQGPEVSPLRREVTLGPGQLSLRLAMERWIDLRTEGWYAGDVRAHDLPPHAALLEGAAEGLAVVNLLAYERPARDGAPAAVPNLLAFSGMAPALEGHNCLVAVNTLNAHPVLGTVGLLNSHRVVHPLRFGAPGALDHWSVADWCDQCHRKVGLVVWADVPRLTEEHPQGEALAALVLGKIDAFEVCHFPDTEPDVLGHYYRLLDCGLRVPLAGGSGKTSNRVPLGAVRTYAHLGADVPLTYAGWIAAVRAGRTFVTNAPLLTLSVDEQGPGAVLARSAGQPVRVRAETRSAVPFDQLEVLVNGFVSAAKPASGNRQSAVVETEIPVTSSAWVVARCWSHERLADGQCVYAHTSPVHIEVEGAPLRPDADTLEPLLAVLDRTRAWVENSARCESERQRQHLIEVLQAAQRELVRRGGEDGGPGERS